ncbi:cobyric acid synthase CobQ [Orenia metallireducens]|uniref:Cobyric acid synthase n=1 Tax=Orenia metallireducens TaxID=1413210 RepID=A0A1C0A7B2_9FIRM|nr:cobyric acid synthase [Orenia metallireducens]OCL26136.1 cobyric acid synthase CobQ [Orenia metallireducens]
MANSIMLQGTSSNVGKSILATALCRIFSQDGYQVAPFKSWNMALNSYVTADGGEVGQAQAIQADAAGIEISVDMQPFLIKPKGDGQSQVIVRGRPLGDFGVDRKNPEYIEWAMEIIDDSLQRLSSEYELIVLEGAGSPAEINIKDKDIANMKVAKLNQTPVLLVADIDRGGALAAVVGTLKLLETEERALVKGVILNKFRGDFELLKSGVEILEEKIGKPVLGVIPYLKDIRIPEEDSVSLADFCKEEGEVEIGVINLPHISNFTDFDPLGYEIGVELNYLEADAKLDNYDAIILPGTKNTIFDLNYLHTSGLARKIIAQANAGKTVIGICGGYQMLGKKLVDPDLVEGRISQMIGLGLLDIETTFNREKVTHQVIGRVSSDLGFFKSLKNQIVTGYEIHMGDTKLGDNTQPLFRIESRSKEKVDILDGTYNPNLSVWGTYLHGIFDNDNFRRSFVNSLRREKGLTEDCYSSRSSLEESYDKLAEIIRDNLDMDKIYQIIEEGEIKG